MEAAPEEVLESTPQNFLEVPEQTLETDSDVRPADSEPTPLEEVESVVETPVVSESASPTETSTTTVATRRIYGKITLASTGENLSGVNIMIPGSNVAKISNNIGGYTIEVPVGTSELIFIYRGKKLTKRIGGSNTLLNVRLDLEAMEYD